MSEIVLIVAAAANGVIGKNSRIPWRLPQDMKRFKTLTLGHTVVMGRKTWDSLPDKKRPLPGRRNIVLTRQGYWKAEGAITVRNLGEATDSATGSVFVIGGGEIYRIALPLATRIELTEVHQQFDGDAFFSLDRSQWHESSREDHITQDGLRYSFVTLAR
jgi:dihydrofolate reductase